MSLSNKDWIQLLPEVSFWLTSSVDHAIGEKCKSKGKELIVFCLLVYFTFFKEMTRI